MCFHQQDLGYNGFIANIIICEKVFCPVMVFPAPPIVWCVKTARSNTGEQLKQSYTFTFLSPEGLFHEKSLGPQKIRGQ